MIDWGSESLMGHPLEKLFWVLFFSWGFNKELPVIIWGNWHVEDSRWLGWTRYSSYNKRKQTTPRRDWTYKNDVFSWTCFSSWKKWVSFFSQIEAHPLNFRSLNYFGKKNKTGYQDTNRCTYIGRDWWHVGPPVDGTWKWREGCWNREISWWCQVDTVDTVDI